MILRRCSRGCEPQKEALTWTVSAWVRADGERVAFKQKLCYTCVASTLAPLWTACQSDLMTCPNCGIDTTNDMDAVYVTFIVKHAGKMQAEAPFCGACAVGYRNWAMEGAEKLENREIEVRGQDPGPSPTASQTLAALGFPAEVVHNFPR